MIPSMASMPRTPTNQPSIVFRRFLLRLLSVSLSKDELPFMHGRHELLAGKVTGHSEEHQRRRTGNPVQTTVTRVTERISRSG